MTRMHHKAASLRSGVAIANAVFAVAFVSVSTSLAQPGVLEESEDTKPTNTGREAALRLMFGPVPGFTTAAHEAPVSLVLPQGSSVPFYIEGLHDDETIYWESQYALSRVDERAMVGVEGIAPVMVTATVLPAGKRFQCVVTPMVVTPESLTFTPRIAKASTFDVHEGMTNEEAVVAYYGSVPGDVREVAPGVFSTPANNAIVFQTGDVYASPAAAAAAPADLDDSGFVDAGDLLALLSTFGTQDDTGDVSGDGIVSGEDLFALLGAYGADVRSEGLGSLVEWRFWGQPMGIDNFEYTFSTASEQRIQVGPTNAPREINLTLFDVSIHSDQIVDGHIPDNIPVTFTATTTPPGYEEQVKWLAATKYGNASPMTGTGESFTTVFTNTYGSALRWVGVKAANTRAGGDAAPEQNLGLEIQDEQSAGIALRLDCPLGQRAVRARGHRLNRQGGVASVSVKDGTGTIITTINDNRHPSRLVTPWSDFMCVPINNPFDFTMMSTDWSGAMTNITGSPIDGCAFTVGNNNTMGGEAGDTIVLGAPKVQAGWLTTWIVTATPVGAATLDVEQGDAATLTARLGGTATIRAISTSPDGFQIVSTCTVTVMP